MREAKPGQMVAHLNYITRQKAARIVIRRRVGTNDRRTAKTAEDSAQKRKGRVAERFIIALPVEASHEQREALASAFAEKLTNGKAGFVFAIHDKAGNDTNNPHMHLVAFDVFEKTGGRGRPRSVIGMARKGAVERTAAMWAGIHNEMMQAWGYSERSVISHQSNEARGIERIPTIHEGPTARKMAGDKKTLNSKVEWRRVDAGHSRRDANRLIREINNLKDQISNARRQNRLGGHDEGDRPAFQASRPKQRTDIGRSGGSTSQSKGPNRSPDCPRKGAGGIAGPHFGQEHKGKNSRNFCPPTEHINTAPLANRPPFLVRRRRRRIGRIWHELMMLRDTLKTRFGTAVQSARTETVKSAREPTHRPPKSRIGFER